MLLQQLLEKIMRKKKFSKLVSSCQYYCLLGTVHTTSSAGGFDFICLRSILFCRKIRRGGSILLLYNGGVVRRFLLQVRHHHREGR